MFFRRMFQRKDTDNDGDGRHNTHEEDMVPFYENEVVNGHQTKERLQQHHVHRSGAVSSTPRAQRKFGAGATKHSSAEAALQHRGTVGGSVAASTVQLTPLWEHILRTRALPDSIAPAKMFAEFHERLRDPEWQVRQHALRVFVDVLVVMRAKADAFMDSSSLIGQLVENLGHPAPTVRKGALDCLRVYLAETAMPETIMLQILDMGLNQKITNEPFGGRLTCGVMLSLPALVQSTLHTPKRHFILRSTIDMLVQKMGQVTHQEITLKVLAKILVLIGEREFVDFLSHGAYREFELLCNVYGVNTKKPSIPPGAQAESDGTPSWRFVPSQYGGEQQQQTCWRSSDEEQMLEGSGDNLWSFKGEKVIMETEIKINDDTLTMRILEAKDDDDEEVENDSGSRVGRRSQEKSDIYPNSLEDEIVCGRLVSARCSLDSTDAVELLSDCEVEEINRHPSQIDAKVYTTTIVTPSTPSRTPKRVTFGGEIVKMRTPDSDATSSNNNSSPHNNNHNKNSNNDDVNRHGGANNQSVIDGGGGVASVASTIASPLSLDIPNDNTKPLPRPRSAQSPRKTVPSTSNSSMAIPVTSPSSPPLRKDSIASPSPRSPFKRINISPVDSIISPKVQHKEIEVLHNLQREPSPVRARRGPSGRLDDQTTDVHSSMSGRQRRDVGTSPSPTPPQPAVAPKSWEDLGIVDNDVLMNLRSGDWRLRSHGICSLENALRSSDNLARVQPCLDSLLRLLLSSERNPEVAEEKRRLIMNLISRLPLDNLEDRTAQIMTGLCRQGGAGANRVCKALMQRLPPSVIVLRLLSDEFLHARSSKFREHALQMVMYSLMTFPSTCFDNTTCLTRATYAALDRKKRVRQAALDVLAILGQMTSTRVVLEVVQGITKSRDEGSALMAAIKTRLSRKQLPLITAEGTVQYTLRFSTSPNQSTRDSIEGPDIEWINAGVGSVSPTSLKRRAQRNRSTSKQQQQPSFCCLPREEGVAPGSCGSNCSDDSNSKQQRCEEISLNGSDETQGPHIQYVLGSSAPLHFGSASRKSNVDFGNYTNHRHHMVAKSCSDSSMDGRSSDSTYTSSTSGVSGGSGRSVAAAVAAASCVAANGDISGRFTRQAVNSRFPAMDRMDLNATYVRIHKPPTCYPGMGAYAQLQQQQYSMNSTYPKVNYTMVHGKRGRQQQQHQQQSQSQQQQHPHQQKQHYQRQQHQYHQPYHQPHVRATSQENFKHQENLNNEKNNNNHINNNNWNFNNNNNCNHNNNNNHSNSNKHVGNLDGTYTIYSIDDTGNDLNHTQFANSGNNSRRFVNVEKFMRQSNKYSQTNRGGSTPTMASDQSTNTVTAPPTPTETAQGGTSVTPTSVNSENNSQKSTASAKSRNLLTIADATNEINELDDGNEHMCSTPTTTLVGSLHSEGTDNEVESESPSKWSTGEEILQIEDIVDAVTEEAILAVEEEEETDDGKRIGISELRRDASLASVQSKTESIRTQLEGTPPVLSRSQSVKSLIIEEQIEGSNFVLLNEEIEGKEVSINNEEEQPPERASISGHTIDICNNSESVNSSEKPIKFSENKTENQTGEKDIIRNEVFGSPQTHLSITHLTPKTFNASDLSSPERQRSPTIAELKSLSRRNSMIKSMESLYERPPSKQGSLDTATTDTSSQSTGSQLNPIVQNDSYIPIKPQHTPLKQKSKTSHFLKSNRRISPVKRSIKMTQAELFPNTLTRFERPREALIKSFDQLDSSNWEVMIVGLKSMVRLTRYHPETLENYMHMTCIQLTKAVRNLRSQVARAACQAATELFSIKSKCLEQECDDLVCALLHRTADTNRFLRADATRGLESMCDNLTPQKILNILSTKGAQHQNAVVRTTTAKLLNRLVERLGCDRVFMMPRENRDKFFVTGANLLLEGSLETRSYAKSMFRQLSDHHNYNRLLLEVIPPRTYRNVEKTLKNIH